MKRESFIFYKSFYEASKYLSKEQKGELFDMICQYGFYGKQPTGDGLTMGMFLLIQPQINANNKRYKNGCKGGAPKGNKNAVKNFEKNTKQLNNQKITKKQPNDNDNVNENVNENDNEYTCPSTGKTTDISKKRKPQYSQEFEEIWRTYPQNGGKKGEMFKAWNEYSEEDHTAFLFGAKLLCLYRNYVRYGETRMSQRIDRWMEGYVKPEDRKADLINSIGQINSIQDEELRQKGLDRAKELFGEDYVRGALIKASGKISLDLY